MPSQFTLPSGLCICLNPNCKIPYGYCHCGCGEKTLIAKITANKDGRIMGMPHRFIGSHYQRTLRKSMEEKFWPKVDKDGPIVRPELGKCWKWLCCTTDKGYGITNVDRHNIIASRASWIIHHGSIPDGMFVLHKCDNPPCTNPDHLFLGTRGDNFRDALQKGRLIQKAPSEVCSKGHSKPSGKRCPICCQEYGIKWYQKNRERVLAGNRYKYAEHKEERIARRRELRRLKKK